MNDKPEPLQGKRHHSVYPYYKEVDVRGAVELLDEYLIDEFVNRKPNNRFDDGYRACITNVRSKLEKVFEDEPAK